MAQGCILIVNDQAAVRSALAEVLRANGYRVLTATTCQEALEVVEVVAFDLLLVDLSRSAISPGFPCSCNR